MNEQDLLDFGFKKTELFDLWPYEKHLSEPDEDGGRLTLVVTFERNAGEFALIMPDGNKLFLNIQSLKQLDVFENAIQSWEPNY